MPLLDCGDGPTPEAFTPAPVTTLERLYASLLCMADELTQALPGVPHDGHCRETVQHSITALVGCSAALLRWLEHQEDARG